MLAGTGKMSLLPMFTHNPQSLDPAFCGPNSGGEGLALPFMDDGWGLLEHSLVAEGLGIKGYPLALKFWLQSTLALDCVTRFICLGLDCSCNRQRCASQMLELSTWGKLGPHEAKDLGFWKTLQVVLMMKHHQFVSILQSSLHLTFLLTVPTYFIQQPCLVCQTVWNIWLLPLVSIPPLTKVWCLEVFAFCQVGVLSFQVETSSMLDVAYFISGSEGTAVAGVYFLPVARGGATPFIIGFWDSALDISILTLAYFNSSTKLVIGSEKAPSLCSPKLLRHLGNPSHFLTCMFLPASKCN